MRDENSKRSKLSWPKTLVKKWFNIKSKAEEFQADDVHYGGGGEEWRHNFSEREACTIKKSKTETSCRRHSGGVHRGKIDLDAAQVTDVNNYRIFVATWNVAGKSPPSHLNLEDWLHTSPPADIYVLGFQEIVPLNAGNVLGTEDNGPAKKWLALTRKTLNSLPGTSWGYQTPSPVTDPIVELDADFEGSTRQKASSFFHRRSFQSLSRSMRMDGDMAIPQPKFDRRFSVCDRVIFGNRSSDYDPNYQWGSSDDENGPGDSPCATQYSPIDYSGSLSVEDRDRQTGQSSHLTSGQKEGDELRRNSDVMEILRKTRFPRVHTRGDKNSPQTILEHDRIIWLGDLNYRIALPYRAVKTLVEMHNWRALLENDQLRIEQRRGRVFDGWNEGKIYFPPTYKYSNNSDRYAGDDRHPKGKRRTPAWCDRILWYGRGLTQLSYVRGESRFSDHRPVCGVFLAEVESINRSRIKKSMSCSNSRIEVEELLTALSQVGAALLLRDSALLVMETFYYLQSKWRCDLSIISGSTTLLSASIFFSSLLANATAGSSKQYCPSNTNKVFAGCPRRVQELFRGLVADK
ncbi:TYPE I INOSITOL POLYPHOSPHATE 5-PHOSPHATASE 4 [Salix purpurea]|uniref:TYPE I INOSITOL POLYPHOSPHATE 5-PHOSPHATASE 4 n=1 Tax=Salix purpurea TaxID=77065 RepID=A0A9Q0WUS3_SALPP|nr:TYPE I INOSITOL POLYPHOSPHATE 5-PHOSPHATASE 4 [Salix purpurea]